jgi:hypothetical protein
MKFNIKSFLPVLAATMLSIATPSLANAANQDGDICGTTQYVNLTTTFKCANLFDGQRLSIAEIYQKGYRVVTSISTKEGYTNIIIEKQK